MKSAAEVLIEILAAWNACDAPRMDAAMAEAVRWDIATRRAAAAAEESAEGTVPA